MDQQDSKAALAAILADNLSKDPALAAKQRRLLEMLQALQSTATKGDAVSNASAGGSKPEGHPN